MPATTKLKTLLPYLVPLLLLIAVALLYLRMQDHRTQTDAKTARDASAPIPVDVLRATSGEVELSIPTECVAEANPLVRISNPVTGNPVSQTHVRIGEQVAAGTLLLNIDDRAETVAVRNAKEQVDALTPYVKAERERLDYFIQVRAQGMGLERDAKQAGADWAKAQVDLENARAELRKAQAALERTHVRSPVNGVVMGIARPGELELSAVIGESDKKNSAGGVAALGVIDPILIECQVPEEKLILLRPTQEITASFPSLPGERYVGHLQRINPSATQDLRTVGIAIELPNPQARLLPGVHGLIEVRERWQGLRIPSVALVNPRADVAQVFVVDSDNKARLRQVSVGGEGGGYVQILKGLQDGEQVVVVGQVGLAEGDVVRVGQVLSSN